MKYDGNVDLYDPKKDMTMEEWELLMVQQAKKQQDDKLEAFVCLGSLLPIDYFHPTLFRGKIVPDRPPTVLDRNNKSLTDSPMEVTSVRNNHLSICLFDFMSFS